MSDDTNLKTKKKVETQRPKQYVVKFINDDFTPIDIVTNIIQEIFKKTHDEAVAITMQIHKSGSGIVGGPYTLEIAESKVIQTEQVAKQIEMPLKASTEEA